MNSLRQRWSITKIARPHAMKKWNRCFILLTLLAIPSSRLLATAQNPDILIYKGDTLSIYACPLEQLFRNDSIRPNYFGDRKTRSSTACWREYIAKWIIIEDNLYLTGIYSCSYGEDSIKADLKGVFGDKCINGKVKADWFTDTIIAPQGKLLFYVHMGFESLYEKELEFQFINGHLLGTKLYDNSKSRKSVYSNDPNILKSFIYSNINWSSLPKLTNEKIKVWLTFTVNENGCVDSVRVIKGSEEIFNNEAMRVTKLIPEWDVYYRHGKFEKMSWVIPIEFCEEKRNEFCK